MSNLDRQVRGAKINPMDNPFGDERACFLSKIVFKDRCSKCSTWHPKTLYYTYRHKTVILTGTSQLYLQGQVSYTYRGKSVILLHLHHLQKSIVVLFYACQLVGFEGEGKGAAHFLQTEGETQKTGHVETLSVAPLHEEMTGADEQRFVVLYITEGLQQEKVAWFALHLQEEWYP